MIIAIDFDGTIVEHKFPMIGPPVPHAERVIRALKEQGHYLILYTMRSMGDGANHLKDAVQYCKFNSIIFDAINCNPDQSVWTSSPKVYAQLYIDDAALGCPLIGEEGLFERKMVDWLTVEKLLIERKILKETNNDERSE